MPLTVHDILGVEGLSLRLLAGEGHTDGPVRWVHASELEDPTPWLKGGELILTTGMGVGATPAQQRVYVKRLATVGAAGLGFGLGFGHERTPKALVNAADAAGLLADSSRRDQIAVHVCFQFSRRLPIIVRLPVQP